MSSTAHCARSQITFRGRDSSDEEDKLPRPKKPLPKPKKHHFHEVSGKYSVLRVTPWTDQSTGVQMVQKCVSGIIMPSSSQAGHISQLLTALLKHQGSLPVSVDLLEEVVNWLSRALSHCLSSKSDDSQLGLEILKALQAALRDASDHSDEVYISLAGACGSLIYTLESAKVSWYHKVLSMNCLHLLTYVSPEAVTTGVRESTDLKYRGKVKTNQKLVFEHIVKGTQKPCRKAIYLGLTASTLSVLYNLAVCAPGDVLGNIIVSACRPFVFYGLPGVAHKELFQNSTNAVLSIPIVTAGTESDSSTRSYTNRNRRKRLRRKRAQPSRSTPDSPGGLGRPVTDLEDVGLQSSAVAPPATALDSVALKPEWSQQAHKGAQKANQSYKISVLDGSSGMSATSGSEETDLSDLEAVGEKETVLLPRVRQCALQAINSVIDKVSGQHKFSFWAPLVCASPSLLTSVLKDPSPAVRCQALQVINTFLRDSHQVLSMAGDDSEMRGSFTGLGQQLGTSLRELHRCLTLALLSEKFPGALVRTLKTIELLVQNVNYSRFKAGLLTKIVTHVKYFMRYKEAIVRANAFSVMVSVLMIKPKVEELSSILLRFQSPAPAILSQPPHVAPPQPQEEELPGDDLEDDGLDGHLESLNLVSEDEGEEVTNKDGSVVSWLIQRCMDSLLTPEHQAHHGIYIQVQLQSLKVLGALVSEHLHLIHQSLPLIQHVISVCIQATQNARVDESVAWRDENHSMRSNSEPANLYETDPSLTSPDPGVVVEHSYALLGQLLVSVKTEMEKPQPVLTTTQAQQLWLWTLQEPLYPLLKKFSASQEDHEESNSSYGSTVDQLKQNIAAANILSHLSEKLAVPVISQLSSTAATCIKDLLEEEDVTSGVLQGTVLVALLWLAMVPDLSKAGGYSKWVAAESNAQLSDDALLVTTAVNLQKESDEVYNTSSRTNCYKEVVSSNVRDELDNVDIRAKFDRCKISVHRTSVISGNDANVSPTFEPTGNLALLTNATDDTIESPKAGSSMQAFWAYKDLLLKIPNIGEISAKAKKHKSPALLTIATLVECPIKYEVSMPDRDMISFSDLEMHERQYAELNSCLFTDLTCPKPFPGMADTPDHRDLWLEVLIWALSELV
ncbi:unnamed protein product, partial [Meganyctiphanes norvegica]